MGNSFGCSASGERLVSAARDGDLVEAKMLLECNPCLAKYSTFGGLNSPLHFAASKGHNEIVALLLENGADVNSRNYCGQTALMQACRYGHWEVVQTLLLFRCNVVKADYLSGRTALHFAAINGHARCIRLVLVDFVPSAPFEALHARIDAEGDGSNVKNKHEQSVLSKFVNKTADAGITALHMAALNGHFDCVQLLLDLNANVSAATFHYGTSMDLIGAGSTPLHYAACGGNLKCCQILLARGASRMALNCNGWLPLDVARMWGRHWLEPLLTPTSDATISSFPSSNYLSLPLMSVLNIARECGLQSTTTSSNEVDVCAVCLERQCSVAAEGCGHELCVRCALYLCSTSNVSSETCGPPGSIPCPLCRHGIISFVKLPGSQAKENKLHVSLSLCTPCMLHPCDLDRPTVSHTPEIRRNRVASVPSEMLCPVTCTPFPSVAIPLCTCNNGPCPSFEPREAEAQGGSPLHSHASMMDQDKMDGPRLEKTTCSGMFWGRRSCSREHQCNSEINA
ncbi:E3 ubiquitin-protein ligase XBAT33-like [Glycine soja]|uniref:RING-type E3 ubiquitin transferase n=1 Tax=Glycine soja TaxID=3848 RepID=A0A0B2RAG4_GLYSO|nr:E3 ubiquitin-protein ligase XBAT33-like [Glycine soja]KHN31521.1 E3 ubiquitin-protein ligase XBAT33 [Glycine soja]RZB61778.1 E3 ubiquitin-protein ligase XBAT33 isoform A [Glycine soja]